MERANIDSRSFRTAFVLVLVFLTSLLFLAVIWPFLQALMMGAIFAGLCGPIYRWFLRLFRGRASLASLVTLLLLFLVIAGPISAFVGLVVKQALHVSEGAIPWLRTHVGAASAFNGHDWLVARFPSLADYVPSQEELVERVGTYAQTGGRLLVAGLSRMTAGTAAFLLDFFVMLYAMFFFMKDGTRILERIFYYLPLSADDEERMLQQFASITRATVKGTLLIGLMQGTLAGLAFWVAGIDGAAFWGTLMVILSIVPGIGATLVWAPAVIYLYVTHEPLKATLLFAWCAAVVGTIDNLLRPILVGKDAQMPDLLILIGTLGGLFLFGPVGFIFGPIVCGLFLTVWDIYGTTFRNVLPPVRKLGAVSHEPPPEIEPPTLPS